MNKTVIKGKLYYKQLDSFRAIAVFSVMVGHWILWDTDVYIVKFIPWTHGVLFFFVLSGFLITEILLRSKDKIESGIETLQKSIKTFYIRRTIRIFPIYYLLVFLAAFLNFEDTRAILPYLLTYSTNLLQSYSNEYVGSFSHFWSLAVEEQFYLFWPLFILLVPKKHLAKFILGITILSIVSRMIFEFAFPTYLMAQEYFTLNVMYALSLGGIVAYIKYENKKIFHSISSNFWIAPLVLIVYTACRLTIFPNNFLKFLTDQFLFCVFAALLIARAVGSGYKFLAKHILEHKALSHFGQISYGLYVYHFFVPPFVVGFLFPLIDWQSDSKEVYWLSYFVVTILAAEISYYAIERPINKLKMRFQ